MSCSAPANEPLKLLVNAVCCLFGFMCLVISVSSYFPETLMKDENRAQLRHVEFQEYILANDKVASQQELRREGDQHA